PSGLEQNLLQHSSEHGGLRDDGGHAVLRTHRRERRIHDGRRARRQLYVSRVAAGRRCPADRQLDDVRWTACDQVAMKHLVAALCAACVLPAADARAQSITTEAALTAGASTDSLAAGSFQLRGFGDVTGGVRYFGEASFARTSDDDGDNDGFAAAYPYGGRFE